MDGPHGIERSHWSAYSALLDEEALECIRFSAWLVSICPFHERPLECPRRARSAHLCAHALADALACVVGFCTDHFAAEEALMTRSGLRQLEPERCERHLEAHAQVSARLHEIVAAADRVPTHESFGALVQLIGRFWAEHAWDHDRELLEALRRLG